MKIHLVQKRIDNTNLTPFLEGAKAAGADLICFGEMATTGCIYEPREVESLDVVLDQLKPYDFAVMVGMPYITEQGAYNSYLYCHNGEHKLYHKINLFPPFGEPQLFLPGTEPGIWETDLGKIGVAICYDIRFGQVFEDLKRLGAEKIFIPAAFPRERIGEWRDMLIARAKEVKLPVVGINSVGNDGHHEFGGCSMVVAPDGSILAEADETSEKVLELIP